jgi:hypothetical protein
MGLVPLRAYGRMDENLIDKWAGVEKRSGRAEWPGHHRAKRHQEWAMVASRRWFSEFIESGEVICDRKASYRAKNAASTSPSLRHLGSARRGLSPNSQALARVYKTFACRISSGTIAARGSRTRRFRAHSAVCLIKTSKSGKRMPSRPPIGAVAIASPPFGNEAAPCATAPKYSPHNKKALVPAPTGVSPALDSPERSRLTLLEGPSYEKRRRISVHIDTPSRFVWTSGRQLPA